MKIFVLCVVKNEADIIEAYLKAASHWADRIFVYDGQSTDGTWEKVCALRDSKIVPWKQDGKDFTESMRGEIFRAWRHEASEGDWWCILDADEFLVNDPRPFLAQVPTRHHVVWAASIEYYLTQGDLQTLDFTAPTDSFLPTLRHYRIENAEPRFFRHRPGLVWRETDGLPRHMGLVVLDRLLLKHYKYRSPAQIQLRLDTRKGCEETGFVVRDQYRARQWEEKIFSEKDLDFDQQDGTYRFRNDRLPQHVEAPLRRLIKYFLHGFSFWPCVTLACTLF